MNNALITKAWSMLEIYLEKQVVDHKELTDKACEILKICKINIDTPEYDDILREVVRRYEESFGIKTYEPNVLIDDINSDAWFSSQHDVNREYFNRYRNYLHQAGWDNTVLDNLENSCVKILSRCADPHCSLDSLESKKRGLVMGDVQAGKTANYLGLINLAKDYGYHVILLLAGLTNSLREQTQNRVDEGFIGAVSTSISSGIPDYIGVGENAHRHFAIPLTNSDWDFKKFIQKNTNSLPTDYNKPVILVVKKHAGILESVYNYLQPGNELSGNSILIIDDEADNATPNTKKPDYDPSAVNRKIRDIYNKYPIASYIGFTATPFANIFINPFDSDEYQDLFPHDFIVQLNAPNYYFGGERVFPEDGSIPSVVRVIDPEETNAVPLKHKKDYVIDALPESLKEAILSFLINNVVRTLRKDKTKHRSMMINVTPLNDPQETLNHTVTNYINKLKNIIEQDSLKPLADFIKNTDMRMMYDLYTSGDMNGVDFYSEIRDKFSWEEIQHGLYDEMMLIETTVINNKYRGDFRYDYRKHAEKGSRVIVIGGFVLSRGLTLEGLCVSYYSRSATSYDTLLQMCRWFGYRPNYDDLCRVYISKSGIDNFSTVLDAVRDLKEQFKEMELNQKKPSEFGLMIKESPSTLDTRLLVTARNKMQYTQTIEHYINYGGFYGDTSKLFKDPAKNSRNRVLFETFIKNQKNKGIAFSKHKNRNMLCGVDKADIADFISKIVIPSGKGVNQHFDCVNLSAYALESNNFPEWDVVVATGNSEREFNVAGESLPATMRTFSCYSDENYIRIGKSNNRILDPGIFNSGIELTENDIQRILSEKRTRSNENTTDQFTAKDWLKLRNRPLLAVYYIELSVETQNASISERNRCVEVKEAFGDDLLIGYAIGFPAKEAKELVKYRANAIKTNKDNQDDDFDESELDDE
jgi:hypothetical protein